MQFSLISECGQTAAVLKIKNDFPMFINKQDVLIGEVRIFVSHTCPEADMQIFLRDRGNSAESWSQSTVHLLPHEMRAIGQALITAAEFMEGRPDVA